MVEIVAQKVCAVFPSVTIIDPKKGAFRPIFLLSFFWLHYVQNYAHSVFVVVPDESLICVG